MKQLKDIELDGDVIVDLVQRDGQWRLNVDDGDLTQTPLTPKNIAILRRLLDHAESIPEAGSTWSAKEAGIKVDHYVIVVEVHRDSIIIGFERAHDGCRVGRLEYTLDQWRQWVNLSNAKPIEQGDTERGNEP